ncbi:MAG: L,D-transpeptidase family protein [Eubacterium sp.]|nr:L,D-transpeptidase family protein [Eubacterium sp.]
MRKTKKLLILLAFLFVFDSISVSMWTVNAKGEIIEVDSEDTIERGVKASLGKWKKAGGRRRFIYSDGSYARNEYIDGCWLDSEGWYDNAWDGAWKKNKKGKWFQSGSWYPKDRWLKVDGKWYFFDVSGYMCKSKWIQSGGAWYYLKANGQMAVSEKVGKYRFDSTGKWIDDRTIADYLKDSQTAKKTKQIVTVIGHDLYLFKKKKDGTWKKGKKMYCGYGSNGLTDPETRVAGSRTTPKGSYKLTLAFGIAPNPGTKMTYRNITENSYWSQGPENYNRWVESSTPIEGEHLIDYYQYKYAMNIGFNRNPTVYGRGAAIFVHCKSINSWETAGCVSLEESDMVSLMKQLKNGAYIIIVENKSELANY